MIIFHLSHISSSDSSEQPSSTLGRYHLPQPAAAIEYSPLPRAPIVFSGVRVLPPLDWTGLDRTEHDPLVAETWPLEIPTHRQDPGSSELWAAIMASLGVGLPRRPLIEAAAGNGQSWSTSA